MNFLFDFFLQESSVNIIVRIVTFFLVVLQTVNVRKSFNHLKTCRIHSLHTRCSQNSNLFSLERIHSHIRTFQFHNEDHACDY